MMHILGCLVVTASLWISVLSYVPVSSNMKSFSSVIKQGNINASEEKVLYERNTGQPGVITEQWSAGRCYDIRPLHDRRPDQRYLWLELKFLKA